MAEISKINANSTSYDIKDAPSRTALGEAINGGAAGTKNLFDMSGAQTFDVTGYGVHCTINKSTGVITLDGTNQDKKCTGNFNIKVADSTSLGLIAGTVYKLTCDGYTTSDTTIGIYVYTSGATPEVQFDTYNHTELAWNSSWEQSNGFRLFVRRGTVVNNITLRPMLCRKTLYDVNPDYEPYAPAKTNVEITPALVEVVDAGAKNLVQIMQDSLSIYNIVFSVNKPEGTITITGGTASAYKAFRFFGDPDNTGWSYGIPIPKGTYVLSGLPSGASQTGVRYILGITTSQSDTRTTTQIWDGDYVFTITNNTTRIDLAAYVPAGQNLSTPFVFKPMICSKSQWDVSHQFEPYALPNPTITPALIEQVDNGAKNKFPPFETQSSRGSTGVTYSYTNGIVHATGTKSGSLNYIEVVENRPISELGFSVGDTLTLSNTNDSLLLTIILGDGTTFDPAIIVGNETKEITIGAGKTHIYIRTQILSSVTGTIDLSATPMICYKAIWDVSHQFEPYALSNPVITPALVELVDDGAKNLLKIEAIGADSTTYGTTVTKNGVEYALQADGSIVINRVSSNANSSYIFFRKQDGSADYITDYMDNEHYLSGITGGSVGTYALFISNYNAQGTSRYIGEPSLLMPSSVTPNAWGISIASGYSPVNLVIKPMICTAADWAVSQKYVPYCPSMAEMYEKLTDDEADITSLKHMVNPRSQSQVSSGNLDNITVSEMRVYSSPSGLPTGVSASSVCIVETCVVDSNSAYQIITLLSNQGTAQDRSYPTYKRVKVGGVWYDWKLIAS